MMIFFKCAFPSFSLDFFYDNNFYNCSVIAFCNETSCRFDDTDMPTFSVDATLSAFQNQCIEPVVPVTSEQPAAPTRPSLTDWSVTTARFEARWGVIVESSCSSDSPTVQISCLNGEISVVNLTSASVECTNLNASTNAWTVNWGSQVIHSPE